MGCVWHGDRDFKHRSEGENQNGLNTQLKKRKLKVIECILKKKEIQKRSDLKRGRIRSKTRGHTRSRASSSARSRVSRSVAAAQPMRRAVGRGRRSHGVSWDCGIGRIFFVWFSF